MTTIRRVLTLQIPLRAFIICMDTGIISVLIRNLPYDFRGRNIISTIWFVANLVLWLFLFLHLLVRFIVSPRKTFKKVTLEKDELLCLPAISISLTTLYEMIASTCGPWNYHWYLFSYVLWWITSFISFVFGAMIPFNSTEYRILSLGDLEPTMLLSAITALTSATGGGYLSLHTQLSPAQKVPMIIVSYILLGYGMVAAMIMSTLVFARLYLSGMPPKVKVPGAFVLVGPFGQAAFAFESLGKAVMQGTFAKYDAGTFITGQTATTIGVVGVLNGLLLYGAGFLFFLFAILRMMRATLSRNQPKRGLPFSLSWWSIIFPVGVWTSAAERFGTNMDSDPWRVWSTICVMGLVLVWFVTATFTLLHLFGMRKSAPDNSERPQSQEMAHA